MSSSIVLWLPCRARPLILGAGLGVLLGFTLIDSCFDLLALQPRPGDLRKTFAYYHTIATALHINSAGCIAVTVILFFSARGLQEAQGRVEVHGWAWVLAATCGNIALHAFVIVPRYYQILAAGFEEALFESWWQVFATRCLLVPSMIWATAKYVQLPCRARPLILGAGLGVIIGFTLTDSCFDLLALRPRPGDLRKAFAYYHTIVSTLHINSAVCISVTVVLFFNARGIQEAQGRVEVHVWARVLAAVCGNVALYAFVVVPRYYQIIAAGCGGFEEALFESWWQVFAARCLVVPSAIYGGTKYVQLARQGSPPPSLK